MEYNYSHIERLRNHDEKGNITMNNNVVRIIPNGKYKATIEFYNNPKRQERGNQKEFQKLSLQYFSEKVSNMFYEEFKDDYIFIIFKLEDGTLFEPFPIKNTLQKGSILRGFFESFGYDDIKEMRKFDDDTIVGTKVIIETKKVSRRYTKKEYKANGSEKKTYPICKLVSMVG